MNLTLFTNCKSGYQRTLTFGKRRLSYDQSLVQESDQFPSTTPECLIFLASQHAGLA